MGENQISLLIGHNSLLTEVFCFQEDMSLFFVPYCSGRQAKDFGITFGVRIPENKSLIKR
jgi:hypothetical protein